MLRQADTQGSETAIAIAFLRHGHPWLAFGTVVLKTCFRASLIAALSWAVVTLAPSLAGDRLKPHFALTQTRSVQSSWSAPDATGAQKLSPVRS